MEAITATAAYGQNINADTRASKGVTLVVTARTR